MYDDDDDDFFDEDEFEEEDDYEEDDDNESDFLAENDEEDEYEEEFRMHLERGLDLYEKDLFNDAIDEFTKALSIFPDVAGVYSNRGAAYGQQGKYSEAIADFEMALELDPGNAKYIDNIVMTKRIRGY